MNKAFLTAAFAALLAAVTPAKADLIIWADVGGTIFSCVDNAACDTNPAVGNLQIANQSINGVLINTSIQTQTVGANNILNASSTSIINNNSTPTAINFIVSATNFIGPNDHFSDSGSGVWQTAIGSNVTLNWFDDPLNRQGAIGGSTPGTLIDTFASTALLLTDSFSHNGSGLVNDGPLFSMTEQATGTLVAGGQLLNRGQTEIKFEVPEPMTLALFGVGIIGLGLARRRRETA